MTAWNPKHIMKVSTNKMPCACIDCFFWLAPWNPDDVETPCSCYLTGTTLPWNNCVTGERRLPDCPLKLIRRKKKKRGKAINYANTIYNKALDDFLYEISESILWDIFAKVIKRDISATGGTDEVIDYLQKIVGQLKGDRENGK